MDVADAADEGVAEAGLVDPGEDLPVLAVPKIKGGVRVIAEANVDEDTGLVVDGVGVDGGDDAAVEGGGGGGAAGIDEDLAVRGRAVGGDVEAVVALVGGGDPEDIAVGISVDPEGGVDGDVALGDGEAEEEFGFRGTGADAAEAESGGEVEIAVGGAASVPVGLIDARAEVHLGAEEAFAHGDEGNELVAAEFGEGTAGAADLEDGVAGAGSADELKHRDGGGEIDAVAVLGDDPGSFFLEANDHHVGDVGTDHEGGAGVAGEGAGFDGLGGLSGDGTAEDVDGFEGAVGAPDIGAVALVVEGIDVDEGSGAGVVPEDAVLAGDAEGIGAFDARAVAEVVLGIVVVGDAQDDVAILAGPEGGGIALATEEGANGGAQEGVAGADQAGAIKLMAEEDAGGTEGDGVDGDAIVGNAEVAIDVGGAGGEAGEFFAVVDEEFSDALAEAAEESGAGNGGAGEAEVGANESPAGLGVGVAGDGDGALGFGVGEGRVIEDEGLKRVFVATGDLVAVAEGFFGGEDGAVGEDGVIAKVLGEGAGEEAGEGGGGDGAPFAVVPVEESGSESV